MGPYFVAELPDDSTLITRQMKHFPLHFARYVPEYVIKYLYIYTYIYSLQRCFLFGESVEL